jgi:hypothetical protein
MLVRKLSIAVVLGLGCVAAASAAEDVSCLVFDIDRAGFARVSTIKNHLGSSDWIELGDRLLVCGTTTSLEIIERNHEALSRWAALDADSLLLSRGRSSAELEASGFRIIASSGAYAIVDGENVSSEELTLLDRRFRHQKTLVPLSKGTVALRQLANAPAGRKSTFSEPVRGLVDQVNGNRWFDDVVSLSSFNRYTHSQEIHHARNWIVAEFESMPNLTVTTPSFQVWGTTAYNVVARIDGSARPNDWYVVGGHYDATSEIPAVAAPGAEDNASGCAGVLEMARVFSAQRPQSTVLFICYSGEEQGLLGSAAHVAQLSASGDLAKVRAMLNLDMIGYTADADLDCLLETDGFAAPLMDDLAASAAEFTSLRIVTTTFAWGSDHVPYLDAGVPAVLSIENDWSEYPDYHSTNDLPANLTIAMAEGILRMNVGTLATLAGTESGHVFSNGFESGDALLWSDVVP